MSYKWRSFLISLGTIASTQSTVQARANGQKSFYLDEAKQIARDASFYEKPVGRTGYRDVINSSDCPQSPSGHRVDSLPYWAMDQDIPCMYSGNLLSSDKYENYFFYWLAPRPASLDPAEGSSSAENTPLVVYLNGGPGSTSMNALWTGNGPLRVTETNSGVEGEDFEITYDTSVSWQAVGDLMWID